METSAYLYNVFILLGGYALIYMAVNAVNGLRDGMRMTWFTSVVRQSLNNRSHGQMFRLGMAAMFSEGDTMRVTSALLGFTNGRVISHSECVRAMIAAASWKFVWVLAACIITYMSTVAGIGWVFLMLTGVVLMLFNVSYRVNMAGSAVFHVGAAFMGTMLAVSSISSVAASDEVFFNTLWQYTAVSDVVGIFLSGFAGVLAGAVFSGNLLSFFMVLPFVVCGLAGVECSLAFTIGSEVGTLFPMSMMASETVLQSRKAFLYYAVVIVTVWVADMVVLSALDLSFLYDLGVFGFAAAYFVFFSLMVHVAYHLLGVRLWSKVSSVAHEAETPSKRHLHKFGEAYSPHVSLLLVQAEKEIVNLQFRIHKMLDFTIDLIDGEDSEGSMDHIRKYKGIVSRTGREITDFIITQTSLKNNGHVSGFARERLQAVALQCQLGDIFCDMAEAVRIADPADYPIIRRCVVSLETLYNQATKLINSRFNSHEEEGKVLVEDVEELSLQLSDLLKQYGKDSVTDVLPYTIVRSRAIIVDIIGNLK